jgi:hypothetical protein
MDVCPSTYISRWAGRVLKVLQSPKPRDCFCLSHWNPYCGKIAYGYLLVFTDRLQYYLVAFFLPNSCLAILRGNCMLCCSLSGISHKLLLLETSREGNTLSGSSCMFRVPWEFQSSSVAGISSGPSRWYLSYVQYQPISHDTTRVADQTKLSGYNLYSDSNKAMGLGAAECFPIGCRYPANTIVLPRSPRPAPHTVHAPPADDL